MKEIILKEIAETSNIISLKKCLYCLNSSDRELEGALFVILFDYPQRLELKPSEQTYKFQLNYLAKCIKENNVSGEYEMNRWEALDCLRAWFQRLWKEKQFEKLTDLKNCLAQFCLAGNAQIIDSIITACLEHLFVEPQLVEYFRDWKQRPDLSKAYEEALSLAR